MTKDLRPECKRIFKELKEDISDIKDNHLTHIQTTVAAINTDISWIKKAMFGVLGIGGAILVAYVVSLL